MVYAHMNSLRTIKRIFEIFQFCLLALSANVVIFEYINNRKE